MSGHSKWHKIKHQKEATDKKKGQMFGKLAREIAIVARSEKDPAKNPALREAIARAKKANMPQANIDRLLSGTSQPSQTVTYEAFGPGACGLLITTETDNPNRTLTEVKILLRDHGGHLGGPGSVRWKFSPDNKPLYPLSLAPTDQATLAKLVSELTAHPDVAEVHSDTNQA